MECPHPQSKAPRRPAASLNLERASGSTRGQHVEAGGSVGNEGEKPLAKRDDRQMEIVEEKYSNGGLVHVPHTIQAHFVLDSRPAPLLLQFCLRPGHVLLRSAPSEAARCSCGRKRQSVVRHLFRPCQAKLVLL